MTDSLQGALSVLVGKFMDLDPELQAIMDKAKQGKVSESDALAQMSEYVQAHPELIERLSKTASQELAPFGEGALEALRPPGGTMQVGADRLPRLNPLFEAALIERNQYDGDIPEHRTGPMPEGATPAVSVLTSARNPVAVGKMLENASQRLGHALDAHEAERRNAIEAIEAGDDVLKLMGEHGQLVRREDTGSRDLMKRGSAATDLPTYRRGEVPAPVRTRRPPASALARMGDEDARALAHKFFSTTQGRRTALPTIRGLVADALRAEGWEVTERDYQDAGGDVLAFHEWSATLSGAPGTQASFSFVDTAAKAMTRNLLLQLGETEKKPVVLEVDTVNALDTRAVGWAARLL